MIAGDTVEQSTRATLSRAWGRGFATITDSGVTLDVRFREYGLGDAPAARRGSPATGDDFRELRRVTVVPVELEIDIDDPPTSAADVYLRLHLLSARHVEPNHVNLDGVYGLLTNVAWTNYGPCDAEILDDIRHELTGLGPVQVHSVDKFPRMTDYMLPPGIRIADANRVRLGAHLAPGTAVMHEGFCNFNAGTLGPSMVEGRITQGVVVGAGTDVGAGASIMGTLSGGGKHRVTIGERCLLGANSGVGISLGNDCVVEAGLYVTAGIKVALSTGEVVKAASLSGRNSMLFIRNSLTGAVECRERTGDGVELSAQLH